MNDIKDKMLWSSWAPVWHLIEDQHFSTMITDQIINEIKPPVLIVGAGQGLIVRHLQDKSISAIGLDLNDTMIKYAKEKYDLDLIKGDAADLPFDDGEFNTTIISSGVVDYGADIDMIKLMIKEAKRVTKHDYPVFIAFYQLLPRVEKIYRKIGVIDQNGVYRLKRIFKIGDMSDKNPLRCVFPIAKWTNHGLLRTILYWTYLGLTLPQQFKNERAKFDALAKEAYKSYGIQREELIENVPEEIPYLTIDEIKKLFIDFNIEIKNLTRYDDCVVVKV